MGALLNQKHEKFAMLVAAKGLSASQAYVKAGYSKAGADAGASRLLRNVSIRTRVQELTQTVTGAVIEAEISKRESRLAAQDLRWRLMQELREARAKAYGQVGKNGSPLIPGGHTGLMTQTFKSLGSGANHKIVPEFEFDAALMREMRELEKQSAIECGQWAEKREFTGTMTFAVFDGFLDEVGA